MKRISVLLVSLALAAVTGCGILPKKVEFFQRSVKAVPQVSEKAQETQRQAADFVALKTEETENAAFATSADLSVVAPAVEAHVAAEALSSSVGPPENKWASTAAALQKKLDAQGADLNAKLEDYRKHVQQDVGKKIEGTGWFQIGYFSYVGIIVGLLLLVWAAIRIYGLFNPVVGIGAAAVGRVASSVAIRGLGEVTAGGRKFLEWVENHRTLAPEVKSEVAELFTSAQKEEQGRDVQALIKRMIAAA